LNVVREDVASSQPITPAAELLPTQAANNSPEGIVTLSQIERNSPTTVNSEAWDFNDLVYQTIAQIWLISLNVATPPQLPR
jgi:hypothetical protein